MRHTLRTLSTFISGKIQNKVEERSGKGIRGAAIRVVGA